MDSPGPAFFWTVRLCTSLSTIRPSLCRLQPSAAAHVPLQHVVEKRDKQVEDGWTDEWTDGRRDRRGPPVAVGTGPGFDTLRGVGQKRRKDRKERIAAQSMRPFLF